MAEYRAYTIGPDGHIVSSMAMVCDDDNQAIEKARGNLEDLAIEIWSADRLVARLTSKA